MATLETKPPEPETCDAFGYTALTLDGLIEALTHHRNAHPEHAHKAVYFPGRGVFVPAQSVDGRNGYPHILPAHYG